MTPEAPSRAPATSISSPGSATTPSSTPGSRRTREACTSSRLCRPAELAALHPFDALLESLAHPGRGGLQAPSVAWQHPLEAVVQQPLHGADLLGPRVPADPARSAQTALSVGPQVVAGEQESVLELQHSVAPGMAGSRDDQQV